jgi:membrane associated rhomboid family serine protease
LALPYRWQVRVDRWRSAFGGLFGGQNQQPRPKICPACGTLVGINATRCHQCGTNLNFSMAAVNKRFAGLINSQAPITTVLLIVNFLVFGVSVVGTLAAGKGQGLSILWGLDGIILYRLGSLFAFDVLHGEPYRLVTAMFLHGGLIHIGFNMMALMNIGPTVEEVYGSARYLFLYTATGIAGYVLSSVHQFWSFHGPSVGASGAIMGLIGLLIAITTKRGGAAIQALRSRLISWVVATFAFGFMVVGIDNWAHFGGLASGFLLGKLFADRVPMNAEELKRANVLGWSAALVIVASFAFMMLHFKDPLPQ